MTTPQDNELRETEADVVRIDDASASPDVDAIEQVVDQMLPEGDDVRSNTAAAPAASDAAPETDVGDSADQADDVTSEELAELMAAGGGSEADTLAATRVVDEIARITEAFESMRDSALNEIQNTVREGSDQQQSLTESVTAILAEFQGVRQDMVSTGRVAQESIEVAERTHHRMRDLNDRFSLAREMRCGATGAAVRPFESPMVLIAVAVILLSWSFTFWIRTGDVTLALVGVALANLVCCGMLIQPARRA